MGNSFPPFWRDFLWPSLGDNNRMLRASFAEGYCKLTNIGQILTEGQDNKTGNVNTIVVSACAIRSHACVCMVDYCES